LGRIIGIDYGEKYIGIAITDSKKVIATPLRTVKANLFCENIKEILEHYQPIEKIVIGIPYMQTKTSIHYKIKNFIKKEIEPLGIPYEEYNEAFTSTIIHKEHKRLTNKTIKKRRIDELSATILLRDYIESKYDIKQQYG